MFGTRAEKIANYLAKGSKVAIEGKLRYSSWERDGERRSKLEVIVDEIEFMSRRDEQDGAVISTPVPAPVRPSTPRQAAPVAAAEVYDEDIPF